MSAVKAEEFFHTELYHFTHLKAGRTLIRAGAPYFLPHAMAHKVAFVEKLVRLPYVGGTVTRPHHHATSPPRDPMLHPPPTIHRPPPTAHRPPRTHP